MADPSAELRQAILEVSGRLGIHPSDLGTAISYETGGTFDPWQRGPRTQWGEHRGLIQWGEPQRERYGVSPDMSISDQMRAVEAYLRDAGVRPGHGLLDVYSAINAGRVGLYNRSDADNGGAPGTVADKVVGQMFAHRARANRLLGLAGTGGEPPGGPVTVASSSAVTAPPAQDHSVASPGADGEPAAPLSMAGSDVLAQLAADRRPQFANISLPVPPHVRRARALARAALARQAMEGV